MNKQLKDLFAAAALSRTVLLAIPMALAACGGGGAGADGDGSTYFAVVGTRTAGGVPVTICIDDATYTDPASAAGQAIAAKLAAYYGLEGGYRIEAGTGGSCRKALVSVDTVLSVSEYNNLVVPVAPPPAAPPASQTPPPPPPGPSPVAANCGSARGAGTNGLTLTGQSSYSGLTQVARSTGAFTYTPGGIQFENPGLTAASTTGSLRARLWAVSSAYAGGGINGYVVATYDIQFTDGTNHLTNFHSANLAARIVASTTPPAGSWCMVTTLEQYGASCSSSDGFCVSDWTQFPQAQSFQ